MLTRIKYVVLALAFAISQFASSAVASDHDFDPAHSGHDCVVCIVGYADDDDADGLIPNLTFVVFDSASFPAEQLQYASKAGGSLRIYDSRGPPGTA